MSVIPMPIMAGVEDEGIYEDITFNFAKLKEKEFSAFKKKIQKGAKSRFVDFSIGRKKREAGKLIKPVTLTMTNGTTVMLKIAGDGKVYKVLMNNQPFPMTVKDLKNLTSITSKLTPALKDSEAKKAAASGAGGGKSADDIDAGVSKDLPKFSAKNLPKTTGAKSTMEEKIAEHQAKVDDFASAMPVLQKRADALTKEVNKKNRKINGLNKKIDAAYDEWADLNARIKALKEAA